VKAEEESCVVHVSEVDFRQILSEDPDLAAEVVRQLRERLTDADAVRVTLGRSYQQAADRVQALSSQKAQLEELLRLREEMSGMLVHDLRNPLGVISACLELLERASFTDDGLVDAASVMETMGRSAQRMRRLVDTLLDITRLEEGEMTLRLMPLDLHSLVEEVLVEERALAGYSDLRLENHVPADLPMVLADRDVLQRVLINLLDNSIKFTPCKGRVWVEAHPDAEVVRAEVIDTGPGIPPEEQERIFEKFTQVQGRVGTRRGSGLGLAFCRMAMEAQGGGVWVEDGPEGKGSRFVFVLLKARRGADH